jgi:hypothetical protein
VEHRQLKTFKVVARTLSFTCARTLAWLAQYRRPVVRYERRADMHGDLL